MSFERWTRKALTRLRTGQFLQTSAEWLAIFLLSFGTLVLVAKLLAPVLWPHVLWLALGAIPLAIVAWNFSQKDAFTSSESVAYLDQKLNAGGLLMSLSESPDETWREQLPKMESQWRESLPHYRPLRFAKLVGVPLLFCIACGFVPKREVSILEEITAPTVAEQNVENLKDMMEKLKAEEILKEDEQEQLEEELAKLLENANDPLTHEKWETVDALRQKMQMRIDQSAMTIAKAMNAAETLSNASNTESLTQEQIEALLQQVADGLQTLEQKGAGKKSLGKLGEMAKSGKLKLPTDPAEREKMLNELSKILEAEAKTLSELRKECQGGNCQGGNALQDALANGENPGKGGVNRGRADANLNFGHETDDQNIKFKETILPKGFLDDPNDEVMKMTLAPPEEDVAESAPRSAARESDPSTGKATWNRKLSPRHRKVVKEYFNSGDTP